MPVFVSWPELEFNSRHVITPDALYDSVATPYAHGCQVLLLRYYAYNIRDRQTRGTQVTQLENFSKIYYLRYRFLLS